MATISSDIELRAALDRLPITQQRQIGGAFAESVSHLCREPRVATAIAVSENPDSSEAELADAFRIAKAHSVKTYTYCGRDTDWLAQADHFVAAATAASLLPENQMGKTHNLAWKAAIHARMAKNCEMMEEAAGEIDNEAQRQYKIANKFMD